MRLQDISIQLTGVSAEARVGGVGVETASGLGSIEGGGSLEGIGQNAPTAAASGSGSAGLVLEAHGEGYAPPLESGGIAVGAGLIDRGPKTDEGHLVLAVTPAWRGIFNAVTRDPNSFYQLTSRQFEEFIAGGCEKEGGRVPLTPRSGNRGRDFIAFYPDRGGLRVLPQVKLLKPGNRVTAEGKSAGLGLRPRSGGIEGGVHDHLAIRSRRVHGI